MSFLEKALLAVLAFIVLIVISTTVFAFHKRSAAETPKRNAEATEEQEAGSVAQSTKQSATQSTVETFYGLGRLRLTLLPQKNVKEGATVVISPVFPYDKKDIAFSEELAARIPEFKEILRAYFGKLSEDSDILRDEERLKRDLLSSFNEKLKTGKLNALYFSEFFIF